MKKNNLSTRKSSSRSYVSSALTGPQPPHPSLLPVSQPPSLTARQDTSSLKLERVMQSDGSQDSGSHFHIKIIFEWVTIGRSVKKLTDQEKDRGEGGLELTLGGEWYFPLTWPAGELPGRVASFKRFTVRCLIFASFHHFRHLRANHYSCHSKSIVHGILFIGCLVPYL